MLKRLIGIYKSNQLKMQFAFVAFLLAVIPVLTYLLMSYGSYQENIKKIFDESIQNSYVQSMEQINTSFERLSDADLVAFYSKNQQRYLRSTSKKQFYDDFQVAKENFDLLISINPTITAIQFVGTNGYTYTSSKETGVDPVLLFEELYENESFMEGKSVFVNNRADDYFIIVKKIKSIYDDYFSFIGTGIICVSKSELAKIVNTAGLEDIAFVIKDSNGGVVASSGNVFLNPESGSYLYRSDNIENTDFSLEVYVSTRELSQFKSTWVKASIFVLLIIAIFVIIIIMFMNYFMFRPMNFLTRAFALYGDTGKVPVKKEYTFTNEITDIVEKFNDMTVKNKELNKRILTTQATLYEAELEKRQLELNSLHMQIKSHFLYNTLANIRGMMQRNRTDKAVEMLSSLYSFLRYITTPKEFVLLDEELLHVKNYVNLQNIRLDREIRLSICMENGVENTRILKLILQPLVENAIMHGLCKNTITKLLIIKGKIENDKAVIKIMDSGIGMDGKTLEAVINGMHQGNKNGESIALSNIYKRLMLNYGKQADIRIISSKNIGTVVILTVPTKEGEAGG